PTGGGWSWSPPPTPPWPRWSAASRPGSRRPARPRPAGGSPCSSPPRRRTGRWSGRSRSGPPVGWRSSRSPRSAWKRSTSTWSGPARRAGAHQRMRPKRWRMPDSLRSYGLLLRWNILRSRSILPVSLVIQTLLSVGIVLGFSLLIPELDRTSALYLATGAPTVALISVVMVLAPQMVAQQRQRGWFDYQRAMPVPRLAMLAADATIWAAIALPGVVAAVAVAVLRFDLALAVSPLVVPAVLLAALVTVAIGYGIAYLTPPEVTTIVTNLVVIVALMFSPINYPPERMPDWLAAAHQVLPFQYLAQAVRETLDVPAAG